MLFESSLADEAAEKRQAINTAPTVPDSGVGPAEYVFSIGKASFNPLAGQTTISDLRWGVEAPLNVRRRRNGF